MSRSSSRYRNWWFILYPESAPEDWRDVLERLCVPIAISPLHDMDIDNDGKLKKPHYHIILKYGGVKSFNQVSQLTRSLSQPIPIPVESLPGAYDYLTHANNPEKYQYHKSDILCLNGFEPLLSEDETMSVQSELCVLIKDNNITEFYQLVDLAITLDSSRYFPIIIRNSYFFSQYISSLRFFNDELVAREYAQSQMIGFPVSDSREIPPEPLQERTLWEAIG